MTSERLGGLFWRFWTSSVLANMGDGIRMAAFPLLAVSLTDDPFPVALVGVASAAPWLIAGLAAGSMADRKGARRLLVGADVTRVLVLIMLVAVLITDSATLGLVVAAAFVLGIAETFRDTASQTVIPRLVPSRLLERANGRLVAGEVVGNEFVGPLVGAVLFAAGVALPFAINSAALTIAVLIVLYLPISILARPAMRLEESSVGDGVRVALEWLSSQVTLCGLLIAAGLVAIADAAWFAIFVLYAQVQLNTGPVGLEST